MELGAISVPFAQLPQIAMLHQQLPTMLNGLH